MPLPSICPSTTSPEPNRSIAQNLFRPTFIAVWPQEPSERHPLSPAFRCWIARRSHLVDTVLMPIEVQILEYQYTVHSTPFIEKQIHEAQNPEPRRRPQIKSGPITYQLQWRVGLSERGCTFSAQLNCVNVEDHPFLKVGPLGNRYSLFSFQGMNHYHAWSGSVGTGAEGDSRDCAVWTIAGEASRLIGSLVVPTRCVGQPRSSDTQE